MNRKFEPINKNGYTSGAWMRSEPNEVQKVKLGALMEAKSQISRVRIKLSWPRVRVLVRHPQSFQATV